MMNLHQNRDWDFAVGATPLIFGPFPSRAVLRGLSGGFYTTGMVGAFSDIGLLGLAVARSVRVPASNAEFARLTQLVRGSAVFDSAPALQFPAFALDGMVDYAAADIYVPLNLVVDAGMVLVAWFSGSNGSNGNVSLSLDASPLEGKAWPTSS